MPKKMAIIGLRGIALAPVTENTLLAYASGEAKALPFAGAMNRTAKEKKQDIYYDDNLYAQVNEVLGEDVEIRLGEVSLELLAELGLGDFDETKQMFEGDFSPKPTTYSLRCVEDTVDKAPYYFNWRVFELTGIRYDNFATKGDSVKVCEVIVTGTLKQPAMTGLKPYAIMRALEDGNNQAECDAFMKEGESFPRA